MTLPTLYFSEMIGAGRQRFPLTVKRDTLQHIKLQMLMLNTNKRPHNTVCRLNHSIDSGFNVDTTVV